MTLVLGMATGIGATLSILLLTSFIIAILMNIIRRRRIPNCGCFGSRHSHIVGGGILARNGMLMILSMRVLVATTSGSAPVPGLNGMAYLFDFTIEGLVVSVALLLVLPILQQIRALWTHGHGGGPTS